MVGIVVPYRAGGKTRLPDASRADLSRAMLEDVVAAARELGRVLVVTDDGSVASSGAEVVVDPGGGQGPAVAAGLARVEGRALVVNADLPCVTALALRLLAAAGAALVAAPDGTTNALSLPDPTHFEPVYGPGSAERFAALGLESVAIPELEHDVDTLGDLIAIDALTPPLPLGRRTELVVNHHKLVLARAR